MWNIFYYIPNSFVLFLNKLEYIDICCFCLDTGSLWSPSSILYQWISMKCYYFTTALIRQSWARQKFLKFFTKNSFFLCTCSLLPCFFHGPLKWERLLSVKEHFPVLFYRQVINRSHMIRFRSHMIFFFFSPRITLRNLV